MAAVPAFFMLLAVTIAAGQQDVEISPSAAVRRFGQNLTILCRVPYPIDTCRMTVGTTSYRLIPANREGDVVYSGKGLQFGECGAEIKNIREEWNGEVSCWLPPLTGSIELSAAMRLLVARAPGEPVLITPTQKVFREGDNFGAQCVVPAGRPAANITWYLDDEQLLTGMHQPVVTREPGSDLETVSQNLTRSLTADDSARRLICRAEHPALDEPRIAVRQLIVHYPPIGVDSQDITIFGLSLGAQGRINVTVRAEPPPNAEWEIGGVTLVAPQSSEDGQLTALEPHYLDGGYYNLTLVLAQVTAEDVSKIYKLHVTNEVGSTDFKLKLSTKEEPDGMLGAGAIVAIVIAVVVLIAIIALAVFAKVTSRWCFAGRSHRTDIPDCADSEAPLPPHDDVKGSENPTHDPTDPPAITNGHAKKPDTAV